MALSFAPKPINNTWKLYIFHFPATTTTTIDDGDCDDYDGYIMKAQWSNHRRAIFTYCPGETFSCSALRKWAQQEQRAKANSKCSIESRVSVCIHTNNFNVFFLCCVSRNSLTTVFSLTVAGSPSALSAHFKYVMLFFRFVAKVETFARKN